ncbi:MAG: Fic family protein [Acutalibacteraceae bacterium]
MELTLFTRMLQDKHFTDYKKMQYKYGKDFGEFLNDLEKVFYKPLPLADFDGNHLVYTENVPVISKNINRFLMKPNNGSFGIKAAEDEIISTSAIEGIDFNRESVRNILKGYAPKDEQENRIAGLKKGFDFIADTTNKINEENLYKLYMMTVGEFLDEENKLQNGCKYRHDVVYVVDDSSVAHAGIDHKKLPGYMKSLIDFINAEDTINDLLKAAIVHFYIAYLHPYFDGNGRMARLVHLWVLIQSGYQSVLYVPLSSKIKSSKKAYYDAFTKIENNAKISGKIDVTPFLIYFVNEVYNKITKEDTAASTLTVYDEVLKEGKITEKEAKLWQFVLSAYGTNEFSTKQLEKDFGDAAYATIRSFVLKFEKAGLLTCVKYGTRVKYKVGQ